MSCECSIPLDIQIDRITNKSEKMKNFYISSPSDVYFIDPQKLLVMKMRNKIDTNAINDS